MKKKQVKNSGSLSFEGKVNFNDPLDFEIFNNLVIDAKITEAIQLLKENGYEVFKPTFKRL